MEVLSAGPRFRVVLLRSGMGSLGFSLVAFGPVFRKSAEGFHSASFRWHRFLESYKYGSKILNQKMVVFGPV